MSSPSSSLVTCTEELNHPRVTVKAHGRSATFLNPGRTIIKKVDIDCWLHAAGTAKADYVVCMPKSVDVIVELKGKDIIYAVDQILATHAHWKKVPLCAKNIGALVVFTRSPERSAVLGNIKARLLAKHGIWLEMGKTGLKDYEFEIFTRAHR
jgi:hypothetical protein